MNARRFARGNQLRVGAVDDVNGVVRYGHTFNHQGRGPARTRCIHGRRHTSAGGYDECGDTIGSRPGNYNLEGAAGIASQPFVAVDQRGGKLTRSTPGRHSSALRKLSTDSCGCAMGARFLGATLVASIAWFALHWHTYSLVGAGARILMFLFAATILGKTGGHRGLFGFAHAGCATCEGSHELLFAGLPLEVTERKRRGGARQQDYGPHGIQAPEWIFK